MNLEKELLTKLGARLVAGNLTSDALLAETDQTPAVKLLPDANMVKIGGQSLIDRGREAVWPLLDELVECLPRHKLMIGTGAGTRARHAYSLGIDLGMPVGVLSVLGTFVAMQNAHMIHYLLAKHGIPYVEPSGFTQLPLYLEERRACVFRGMPPYIFWMRNPEVGGIPPHRTDTGVFLVAETFGVRSLIYVKDEDGLYTADPKKDPKAKFIPKATVAELRHLDLDDVVVERPVLDMMMNARHVRQLQVINGLKRGNLTRALDGEHVGTIITAD
jgi:molybdenum storage protein